MSTQISGATGVTLPSTPAQFDNSLAAATTAFVQRAMGGYSSEETITGAITLNAGDFGQSYVVGGSTAYAVTLPSISVSPSGSTLTFWCSSSNTVTIQRAGADTISANGTSSVTSVALVSGDSVTMVSTGSAWFMAGGSAQLGYSTGMFGASLTSNGYQKLPSGLIIQWGYATSSGTTSPNVVVTLPIAFTSALYSMTFVPNGFNGTCSWASNTLSTLNAWLVTASTGAGISGNGVFWTAIGK